MNVMGMREEEEESNEAFLFPHQAQTAPFFFSVRNCRELTAGSLCGNMPASTLSHNSENT